MVKIDVFIIKDIPPKYVKKYFLYVFHPISPNAYYSNVGSFYLYYLLSICLPNVSSSL